ncbi:hypothetical protein BCL69_100423 [Nitrosomonas communis]|uniref:Uncharacterized protein n=1 Tax=Nitrosomonas communis TaxID=44574 RepID=A0A5D3YGU0_9PROT|nr:hypothetical protein BCL69_100423 [Nitrosomonas communis]
MGEELCLSTPGGRVHVHWDENGSTTAWASWHFLPSSWKLLAYLPVG